MYLNGEFQRREAIIGALRGIQDQGLTPDDIDVYSHEPLEIPNGVLLRRSHMSLAVVTGSLCFGIFVVAFVYFAQFNYPLITGGMPIFSFWATGVVFYELTMLGAILTSLISFLYESGVLNLKRGRPAPSFELGNICLRIRCTSEQEPFLRRLLEMAGATNLRTEAEVH